VAYVGGNKIANSHRYTFGKSVGKLAGVAGGTGRKRTAAKRTPARRGAPARPDFDDLTVPGNSELDDGVVVTLREGIAAFRPQSWDRLSPEVRQALGDVMLLAGQRRHLADQIGEIVVHLHGHGVPWSAIGWATGMTAEGARRRWGAL